MITKARQTQEKSRMQGHTGILPQIAGMKIKPDSSGKNDGLMRHALSNVHLGGSGYRHIWSDHGAMNNSDDVHCMIVYMYTSSDPDTLLCRYHLKEVKVISMDCPAHIQEQ